MRGLNPGAHIPPNYLTTDNVNKNKNNNNNNNNIYLYHKKIKEKYISHETYK